jgi:histone H3/H4
MPASKISNLKKGASGGAVRHRKIPRANLQDISTRSLQRVLRRGGVKRVSKLVYMQLRAFLKIYLEQVIRAAVVFLKSSSGSKKPNTIMIRHVQAAMRQEFGKFLAVGSVKYGGDNHASNEAFQPTVVQKKGKNGSKKGKKAAAGGKQRKFRPGTKSIMEIKKMQKTTDILLQKAPVFRLIRSIAHDEDTELRFSKPALEALLLAVEGFLVELSEAACINVFHAKRVTIMTKDIALAHAQRRYCNKSVGGPA